MQIDDLGEQSKFQSHSAGNTNEKLSSNFGVTSVQLYPGYETFFSFPITMDNATNSNGGRCFFHHSYMN